MKSSIFLEKKWKEVLKSFVCDGMVESEKVQATE